MVQETGTIPPSLSEQQLRKLLLEAIDETDTVNPETYHARFDHLDRGLQLNDVIYGLEQEWKFNRPPCFNKDFWQWKYYIDTENADGKPILVVVAVDTLDRSFEVLTRWPR